MASVLGSFSASSVPPPPKRFCRNHIAIPITSIFIVRLFFQQLKGTLTLESTVIKTAPASFSDQLDTYFNSLSEPSSQTRWIQDYVMWHHDTRLQFPDTQLFDHPNAPRLMIGWLPPNSNGGGLHDRSKFLGDLFQWAHEANRVLLLTWSHAPADLELFLEPRFLNFTLPYHTTTDNVTILGDTYGSSDPSRENDEQRIILAPINNGKFEYLAPFHIFWHVLFRPAPPVQKEIDNAISSLKLSPGKYDAVHCRVTHPAFRGITSYGSDLKAVDEQGAYEFKGDNKNAAVEAAIHGVQCANWIRNKTLPMENTSREERSVYFFSDSQDLVRFMLRGVEDMPNQDTFDLVSTVTRLQSQFRIVGRFDSLVAHLENRDKETPFDAFVSTFVDIYIASKARCLSLGVGNYAYLSTKIKSGDVCCVRHQNIAGKVARKWGMLQSLSEIPTCAV